jgi:hypothetical protein
MHPFLRSLIAALAITHPLSSHAWADVRGSRGQLSSLILCSAAHKLLDFSGDSNQYKS